MRYCPHCQRFNPGRPQFCHYCARTWQIRICNRGHENPANVQFCGTCGSADLTETAGPRSWIAILLLAGLWLLIGLSLYLLLAGLIGLFQPPQLYRILPLIMVICLLVMGFQFILNLLPRFMSNGVRIIVGWGRKLIVAGAEWFLRKVWEILR
jgi:hypothetical protein